MSQKAATSPELPWIMPEEPDFKIAPGEVHVWRMTLNAKKSVSDNARRYLSPTELERAARFRIARDAQRFILSRALVRVLLSHYFNTERAFSSFFESSISPADIEFATAKHGKPYLRMPADFPAIEFNLSHSKESILIGVSYARAIGVDIEFIHRPSLDIEGLIRRYFCESEIKGVKLLCEAQKRDAFYKLWTGKEAYLKATGEGLTRPLNSVEISTDTLTCMRLVSIDGNTERANRWTLKHVPVDDTYRAACVVEKECRGFSFYLADGLL